MIDYEDYRIFYEGRELIDILLLKEEINFFGVRNLHIIYLENKKIHDRWFNFNELEFVKKDNINLKLPDSKLDNLYKEVKKRYKFKNIDDKKIIAYLENENRYYRSEIKNMKELELRLFRGNGRYL